MSSVVEQVITAAAKLHAMGTTPSTAIVKAKLGGKVPMPVLIDGISRFKAMSEEEKQLAANKAQNAEQKVEIPAVPNDLSSLKQQLVELHTSHQQLQNRVEILEAKLAVLEGENR